MPAVPGRILAVGDIHGCLAALDAVLAAATPRSTDTIVTLGDYVDRGPDCSGCLERLIELGQACRLVPILGNHEEMLLSILDGAHSLLDAWLSFGGEATLASYGAASPEDIPATHISFLRECLPWYETERHFFVHGSYVAALPLDQQPPDVLRWEALHDRLPGPHCSGKTAIVGHTAQKDGQILDVGYLKCIDTCVYGDGWLTAMDVESGQLWQADKFGRMNC